MAIAANNQPYANPAWSDPNGMEPPFWHPMGMSRPVGIAAMILGFALWWPIGLATLGFMVASGRLGCRRKRWARQDQTGNGWQPSNCAWTAPWSKAGPGNQQSSGNHAFDDYRAETLRRLEEEQTEFSSFLERLRFAKDKAEFDQFMAERRQTPRPPAAPDESSHG